MVRFTIQNGDRVQRALSRIGEDFNAKVLYDVHRAAANVVKKELEKVTPEANNDKKSRNKLSRNVMVSRSTVSRTGAFLGFSKRGFYAVFLERGTKPRTTSGNSGKYKKKANRGSMSPKPFVQITYRASLPTVVNYISSNYAKIVNRSLKKIK